MKLTDHDFDLFGLPMRFAQDRVALDARWKALQTEVHPDRFASEGGTAQRVAMQWAIRVNEAYQRLKDPLKRAAYLCERRGAPVEAERNTAMPREFLMQQMAWREALDEAQDGREVLALQREVFDTRDEAFARCAHLLDVEHDAVLAVGVVRSLMFIARFCLDIDAALDAMQSRSTAPAHGQGATSNG